jgi:hypothetical protein
MGKRRNIFRTFTTSALKARADIPAQADISEQTGYIDCSNIKISSVKSVLGATTNSLYELCRHANVNHWSTFGPTVRTYSNTGSFANAVMVNSDPSVAALGDFAGYDHVPYSTPGWYTTPSNPTDVWVNAGSKGALTADIYLGEIDYNVGDNGGVAFVLFDSYGTIQGWSLIDLDMVGDSANLSLETINNQVLEHIDWYAGVYITNDNTVVDPDNLETTVQCRLPNTSTFGVHILIKAASEWHYDGDAQSIPSPWVQNSSAGMNWNTGYFDIGMIVANQGWTNVRVYARLFDWNYNLIGEGEIFDDVYYPLDDITGSAYLGMASIPAYGYHVHVYFEYTT